MGWFGFECFGITALKIKECSLIGVSQGGMIALLVAAKGGALVKKLVLASSLYKPNAVSKDTFSAWERYCNEGDGKALIEDFGRRVYSKPYAKKNNQALKKTEQNITENKLRRFGILSAAACVFDAGEQIKNITCPVFAICGENDAVLSSEGTREIVKALCCDCYIYENASHAVYDEKPDFIEKVCAFLFGSERFERNSKIKTKN